MLYHGGKMKSCLSLTLSPQVKDNTNQVKLCIITPALFLEFCCLQETRVYKSSFIVGAYPRNMQLCNSETYNK